MTPDSHTPNTDTGPSPLYGLITPTVGADLLAGRELQAIAAERDGVAKQRGRDGRPLLNLLGQGGMGTVYAAFDETLDRKIAVKLIHPRRIGNTEIRERTMREARALARLSHPNVVQVYEVGELDDQLFVAMEFLAGPTLRGWIDKQPRSWQEILAVFRQAGEGLAAAHEQGIVHRDFKPNNAMFGADGRVRVLDFGLARFGDLTISEHATNELENTQQDLTLTGAFLGTPAYMAPEQIDARQATALSDQFSFCVTLFEALYGYRPFVGDTIARLRDNLNAGQIAARPRSAVPRWVHAVLVRGLAVDPAARWPSMQELIATLRRDPKARRRRIAVGTLLVTFAGALGVALVQPHEEARMEPCLDAGAEIDSVWGDTRAAEVQAAVRTKHGPRGDELLKFVVPQIERYATTWSDMRGEACRTHANGQQTANVFELRSACLDQRLASLDSLVDLLEHANAQQLDDIAQATSRLPMIGRCADTPALLAAIPPPDDAEIGARVQAHREVLARAEVLDDAAQYERGLELVATVLADADSLAYEPLVAETWLRKGCIEMSTDPVEAERSLSHALWLGVGIDHPTVAAVAGSKRGFVQAVKLEELQRVESDLPMIAALNRRVEHDPVLYAEYLNNVGAIHITLANLQEGRRWLEAARDLRIARGVESDWRSLATLRNLAFLAVLEHRYAEGDAMFQDIEREYTALYPPTHAIFVTLPLLSTVAGYEMGRPRAALTALRQGLSKVERNQDSPDRLLSDYHSGIAYMEYEQGNLDVALEHQAMALSLTPWFDLTLTMHSMVMAAAKGDAVAVEAYHRQLATEELMPTLRRETIYVHGKSLYALGKWSEAVQELENVRAMIDQSPANGDEKMSCDVALELGKAHRKLGNQEAAGRELHRALAEVQVLYPSPEPTRAGILIELGELELERQHWDEAGAHFEAAEAIYAPTAEADFPLLARIRLGRARADHRQ